MAPTSTSDKVERSPREARKRAAILDAARQMFLANGFLGTSMDQVAATAAVSKQTVYKHFDGKETLFREVVTNVMRVRAGGIPPTFLFEGEEPVEVLLRSFSRNFLKGVMQPDVLKLRRLVIGEVGRFPDLGRAFYDLGPKRASEELARALVEGAGKHKLSIEEPQTAAEHLLSLILSRPLDQSMLLGEEFRFTESTLDRFADEGVAAFLRAYGCRES